MKKIIGVVFFLCMFSVALFAEFVISPTIGYSNIMGKSKEDSNDRILPVKSSMNTFTFGVDLGYVGKSGFTFMFNNNISLLNMMNVEAVKEYPIIGKLKGYVDVKGVFWEANLLLGYTLKPINNLDILFASGLSGGFGSPKITSLQIKDASIGIDGLKVNGMMANFGVPLQVSCNYYFTKNIGIGLSVNDVIGWGIIQTQPINAGAAGSYQLESMGLFNDFTIKIGPTFKF